MSNTDPNNQFLIDIQETESKAEKLIQSALENKHANVAMARAKAEEAKQKTLSEARTKHQEKALSEKTKADKSNQSMIEKFQAETEIYKKEKQTKTVSVCSDAFTMLLDATSA